MAAAPPTVSPIAPQLLPCPFCAAAAGVGNALNDISRTYHFVNCTNCHASTNLLTAADTCPTEAEAVEAWNSRALMRPTEAERHDRMTFAAVFRTAREVIIYPEQPTTAVGSSISLPVEARTRLLALLVDGEPELATAARAFREAFAGGEGAHTTEQWAALGRLNRALGDPA